MSNDERNLLDELNHDLVAVKECGDIFNGGTGEFRGSVVPARLVARGMVRGCIHKVDSAAGNTVARAIAEHASQCHA